MGLRIFQLPLAVSAGTTAKAELIANHDPYHPAVAMALGAGGGLVAIAGDDNELEVWAPAGGETVVPQWRSALHDGELGPGEQKPLKDGTRLVW